MSRRGFIASLVSVLAFGAAGSSCGVAGHAARPIQLAARTEQLPESENRVTLDERDR